MARDWPAHDMAPLVALIADPRHVLDEDGTIRLSDAQARAILELRLARLTALGREEIAEALNKLAVEITEYLDILASRARVHRHRPRRTDRGEDRLRRQAPHRDRRFRSRYGRRGSDPARGHGRAGQPRRLHQARAALDLSRAAARRQGPLRHGDEGGGFRRAAVRRLDAHAGALFLLDAGRSTRRRSGGCRWPRRRRAARRWSICCRSNRASASPRSCRCPRTRRAGRRST